MQTGGSMEKTVGALTDLVKSMGIKLPPLDGADAFDYSRPFTCLTCTVLNPSGGMACFVCQTPRKPDEERKAIEKEKAAR